MNLAYYVLYFMIVLNLCLPHAHAQVVVVAIFDTKSPNLIEIYM